MELIKELARIKCHFMSMYMPALRTKQIYKRNFGRTPNLKNPQNVNEKLQYLKLNTYYNNPVVTTCIDKYKIREYLKQKGLAHILPELYGAYDSVDEIPFSDLPNSFVIKCNHGCGFNILCPNKSDLDIEHSSKLLKKWLKQDHWKEYAEVQYKFIKKKIIVEQFLGNDILSYKFYCFNGIPKVLYVAANGEKGEKDKYIDFFDMNWNHLNISLAKHEHQANFDHIEVPKNFEKMKEISHILSEDFPFVRVDLFNIEGIIYISEMTFIPTGGFMRLTPEGTADEWGSWLEIGNHSTVQDRL